MTSPAAKAQQLLFLCTGNYYRSRFAEILFNHLAPRQALDWQAFSRGLLADRENGNEGPISLIALQALQERAIPAPQPVAFPRQLQEQELEAADLVIAVKEAEHRPLLAERFPGWSERVEYWHVHDLDCAPADEALPELERRIRDLCESLRTHPLEG